ncbi:MAG: hypothetical protein QOG05_1481 [Streptosporangiaceae bacterium]|jgi:hypothetical protein|nr:hypothetical protein [Streptosporangiaceae bacterium]
MLPDQALPGALPTLKLRDGPQGWLSSRPQADPHEPGTPQHNTLHGAA